MLAAAVVVVVAVDGRVIPLAVNIVHSSKFCTWAPAEIFPQGGGAKP